MKTPSEGLLTFPVPTTHGTFLASFSPRGLCKLHFPQKYRHTGKAASGDDVAAYLRETTAALEETLAGKKISRFPKIDLSCGTEFQREVWNVLKRIPYGKTLTYSEIAKKIGREKAVRAVGSACGANPVPVLVPCHRVLAANGKLGGFSGGLDWKKRLLGIEGVTYTA